MIQEIQVTNNIHIDPDHMYEKGFTQVNRCTDCNARGNVYSLCEYGSICPNCGSQSIVEDKPGRWNKTTKKWEQRL